MHDHRRVARRLEQYQNAICRPDALSVLYHLPISRRFDDHGNPRLCGIWTWAVVMSMN